MSSPLTFEFSLTVLNHLGRQLYRNFITVIGEAVSNAWDADATNVWIDIDRTRGVMTIRDDGTGMSRDDLQNKFLKIGYSKRKDGATETSRRRRPFIGAKGIGKLALLSCADTVTVVSRTRTSSPDGCVIDNREIDKAIDEDKVTQEVRLAAPSSETLKLLNGQKQGTALVFDKVRMPNSTDETLRKSLALYFRFTLIDSDFSIHYNEDEITIGDAKDLAEKTQYLWKLGEDFDDPFLKLLKVPDDRKTTFNPPKGVKGFLATVRKPRHRIIMGAKQTIGIDLFVNGRLRQQDILSERPSARVPAQYVYGQIHYDELDSSTKDPFTSSREAVMEDNKAFAQLLDYLADILNKQIFDEWDRWRLMDREDGDDENKRMSRKKRAAQKLVDEEVDELFPDANLKKPQDVFDRLLTEATDGLKDVLDDYGRLYTLENLMRLTAQQYHMKPSNSDRKTADNFRKNAKDDLERSGLAEPCRSHEEDLWYLGVAELLKTVEKGHEPPNGRSPLEAQKDLVRYLRNIVMHTAGLTPYGRDKLNAHVQAIAALVQSIVVDEEREIAEESNPE